MPSSESDITPERPGGRTLERLGPIAVHSLLYIAEFGPSLGYDIANSLDRYGNDGAVYKSLAMLVRVERLNMELIERKPGDSGAESRKLYDLTPFGWYTVGFQVGATEPSKYRRKMFQDNARERLA